MPPIFFIQLSHINTRNFELYSLYYIKTNFLYLRKGKSLFLISGVNSEFRNKSLKRKYSKHVDEECLNITNKKYM